MNKYEVLYYHHHGQCYNKFYVLAKDEEDAKRIFGLTYPETWIEEIYEFDEPEFWTEEEVLKLKKKL